MAREFFKNLPDTTTPLTAPRLNGLLDGDESMGNIMVESISGKNLISGWNNGGIDSTTGADTTSTTSFRTNYMEVDFSSNNYYISGLPSSSYRHFVAAYNANKQFLGRTGASIQGTRSLNSGSFTSGTPQGTGDIKYLKITVYDSVPEGNLKNAQMEKGSSATAYEPYNAYGSNNLKDINLVVGNIRNKNLFNVNQIVNTSTITNNNGVISVTQYANNTGVKLSTLCPQMKAGQTYFLTFDSTARGGDSAHPTTNFYLQGSSTGWGKNTSHTITQAELDGAINIYGSYGTYAGETTTISNIQIEEGTSATNYSSYQGIGYESGRNANGSYIKYDDGTLIQWGDATFSSGGTSSDSYKLITLPIPFGNIDFDIIAQNHYASGLGTDYLYGTLLTPSKNSSHLDNFYVYRRLSYLAPTNSGQSALYSQATQFYWMAIGRWK